MTKKQVLIVGGGFGGIKAALEISELEGAQVTLISDRDKFRYYPSLYHTATGGRVSESNISLKSIFKDKLVKVVIASASKIDKDKRLVITEDGTEFHYDFLVLALGVVTNFFNINGLDEYSYGIKSIEDAEKLKHHLHKQLTDKKQPDLNYVIIGGGPTGIELAGSMTAYLKRILKNHGLNYRKVHIDLIEAAPSLVPRLPAKVSKKITVRLRKLGIKLYLGKTVEGESADELKVSGRPIRSHTVVWTAGVTNHPFFEKNNFELTDHGKVAVDQYLQAHPDIFVIGDNANTTYSGMAQTALYDAEFVKKNLKRYFEGKSPAPYQPKQPITVLPVGPHWAVVVWGNIEFSGRLGWIVKQLAELVAFQDMETWVKASEQWMTSFGEQEECPECAKSFGFFS